MIKKNLILAVVISLIVGLAMGYIFGYILGIGKTKQISTKPPEDVITLKKSKVISRYTGRADGKVSEISDRTLTLISDNETFKISIGEAANTHTIVSTGEKTAEGAEKIESKEIELKEIKVGDRVSVFMELVNNEWQGTDITVLPSPPF